LRVTGESYLLDQIDARANRPFLWGLKRPEPEFLCLQMAINSEIADGLTKLEATLGDSVFDRMVGSSKPLVPPAKPLIPSAKPLVPSAKPLVPSAKPLVPSAKSLVPSAKSIVFG
jgi:hypothetical protein